MPRLLLFAVGTFYYQNVLLKDAVIFIIIKEILQAPCMSKLRSEARLTDVFKGLS